MTVLVRCVRQVMTRKELVLAGDALEEGKALVLVLNKMDALPASQQSQLPARYSLSFPAEPAARQVPTLLPKASCPPGTHSALLR
jgi:predicted GTPase